MPGDLKHRLIGEIDKTCVNQSHQPQPGVEWRPSGCLPSAALTFPDHWRKDDREQSSTPGQCYSTEIRNINPIN